MKKLITIFFFLQQYVFMNAMELKEHSEVESTVVLSPQDLNFAHTKHESIREIFNSHIVLADKNLRNIILEYYNEQCLNPACIPLTPTTDTMNIQVLLFKPSDKNVIHTRNAIINGTIAFHSDGILINSGPLLNSIITAKTSCWYTTLFSLFCKRTKKEKAD